MLLLAPDIITHSQPSCTEVRTERISHEWTIKNFHLLSEECGEKICSPFFYSKNNDEKWRLEFYPRGSADYLEYVSLDLCRDSQRKSRKTVSVEFTIVRSNEVLGKKILTAKFEAQQSKGCPNFLERSKLLEAPSLGSTEFCINCAINLPLQTVTSTIDRPIFLPKKRKLIDDFRVLFEEPIFTDFIVIAGDKKFPTHKVILAKRCPVFARMFEYKEFKENLTNEVRIDNIEPAIINAMLEYIYTDEVTDIKNVASDLLTVADKYELEELRLMSENSLYEGIDADNAGQILQLAEFSHADALKKRVMEYIANNTCNVVRSENWQKAKFSDELWRELIATMAPRVSSLKRVSADCIPPRKRIRVETANNEPDFEFIIV